MTEEDSREFPQEQMYLVLTDKVRRVSTPWEICSKPSFLGQEPDNLVKTTLKIADSRQQWWTGVGRGSGSMSEIWRPTIKWKKYMTSRSVNFILMAVNDHIKIHLPYSSFWANDQHWGEGRGLPKFY